MPATKATTNRTSKPASTPRAKAGAATDATIRKVVQQEQAKDKAPVSTRTNIAEARKKLADAHKEGRHPSNKVQNCPECEKAKNGNGGNGKTTTAKGNGRQTTRKGVAPFPFREVTVLTETYLEVQGLDGESFDLVSCPRCAALIPTTGKSGDKAEKAHRGFHEQIDGLDQRSS
jgi:hypothetical protein